MVRCRALNITFFLRLTSDQRKPWNFLISKMFGYRVDVHTTSVTSYIHCTTVWFEFCCVYMELHAPSSPFGVYESLPGDIVSMTPVPLSTLTGTHTLTHTRTHSHTHMHTLTHTHTLTHIVYITYMYMQLFLFGHDSLSSLGYLLVIQSHTHFSRLSSMVMHVTCTYWVYSCVLCYSPFL